MRVELDRHETQAAALSRSPRPCARVAAAALDPLPRQGAQRREVLRRPDRGHEVGHVGRRVHLSPAKVMLAWRVADEGDLAASPSGDRRLPRPAEMPPPLVRREMWRSKPRDQQQATNGYLVRRRHTKTSARAPDLGPSSLLARLGWPYQPSADRERPAVQSLATRVRDGRRRHRDGMPLHPC